MTISIFVMGLGTITVLNYEYEKALEYRGYNIKYKQYLIGHLYSDDRLTNEKLLDQAYMRLTNRLLDDYIRSKDSQLIEEVIKLSIDHNFRYRNRILNVDADSLIRNRDNLLDTTMWVTDP